jgi:hypothetical protein
MYCELQKKRYLTFPIPKDKSKTPLVAMLCTKQKRESMQHKIPKNQLLMVYKDYHASSDHTLFDQMTRLHQQPTH